MVKKNVALNAAVFESGKTMTQIAEETGIPRMYLSLAQNGKYNLSEKEEKLIAKALNRSVKELFHN